MTTADKLRELLATRPQHPSLDDLGRWWATSAPLITELLTAAALGDANSGRIDDALATTARDAKAEAAQLRADLDAARAEHRREQDARVELDRVKAEASTAYVVQTHVIWEGARLEWAGASFEQAKAHADATNKYDDVTIEQWLDGVCVKIWDRGYKAGGYKVRVFDSNTGAWTWTDEVLGVAPPCCPSSALPGGKHDIGCRGEGKVH